MKTLLLLLMAHALADFPLQGDFLAKLKSPFSGMRIPWQWGMFHHCMIHAGFVYIITDSWVFTVVEFTAHWCIDMLKCKNKLTFTEDQLFHILCKIMYVGVLML